jgi:hypothetical protein
MRVPGSGRAVRGGLRRALRAAPVVVLAATLAGCAPVTSGSSPAAVVVAQPSAPAVVAQAAGALDAAYRQANFGFIRAITPYRPSEPPALISVPRTVYQVVLPKDPGAGYVVIYDGTDPAKAQGLATSMQHYLESGFGETNFPTDAQFAVQLYGSAVVFGWYSPGASADPAAAASALAVLRAFGQPFPVVR